MSKEITKGQNAIITELESQFTSALSRGVEAFQEAGDTLVKLAAIDAGNVDRLQTRLGISRQVINTFLSIGRGELLPQLIAAPQYVRKLPVEDQKRIVTGTVDALVIGKDGKTDTIKVDVLRADSRMVSQVIGKNGIRTLAEQRAVIVAEANKAVAEKDAKPEVMPWRVDGKNIVVRAGVTLTRKDVVAMLSAIS